MSPNHTHRCACGTELRCTQEPDKCAVGFSTYNCPSCLLQQMDDYLAVEAWKREQGREADRRRIDALNSEIAGNFFPLLRKP